MKKLVGVVSALALLVAVNASAHHKKGHHKHPNAKKHAAKKGKKAKKDAADNPADIAPPSDGGAGADPGMGGGSGDMPQ